MPSMPTSGFLLAIGNGLAGDGLKYDDVTITSCWRRQMAKLRNDIILCAAADALLGAAHKHRCRTDIAGHSWHNIHLYMLVLESCLVDYIGNH